MIKLHPYTNNKLMYPIQNNEIINIDKAWEILTIFRKSHYTYSDYQKYCVKTISKNYTLNEFAEIENIIEKMYWNLKKHLRMIDKPIIEIGFENIIKIQNKIFNQNKFMTKNILRKALIYIENKDIILYKFNYPNITDLLISSVMINRSIYEQIMSTPSADIRYLEKLRLESYVNHITFDYAFPNLNTMIPFYDNNVNRINKTKKMYYLNSILAW
jgi:hypothetical protein